MATLTALDVLRAGGNAADAAIAAVAMQCVVEPQSTGIGGDCFVLYSRGGALPVALNGSGRAPGKAKVEWYVEHGIHEIEVPTPHAVTIPGAVDAWCMFNREYGTRPLAELLEPAARAAEAGYIVNPARRAGLAAQPGQAARSGDRRAVPARRQAARGRRQDANPPLAATLRRIGREGREAFYDGPVMRDIVSSTEVARRVARGGGFRGAALKLGRADHCPLSRLRCLRVPTEWAGHGGADDPAHARRLCARRRRLQRGRPAAPARRGEQGGLLGARQFHRRPRSCARSMSTEYLSEARAERARRTIRLDRALPGPHWDEIEHEGHGLSLRRRPRRQCLLVYQFAVLGFRHRHRRAGKRRAVAQPRHRVPHRSPAIPTRSRRGSGPFHTIIPACWSRTAAR